MVKVSILMGSDSDLAIMSEAAKMLEVFGIDYEMKIISAHRMPDIFIDYVKSAEKRGIEIIIAGAGGAAHLPGMAAAIFPLPVIGVPIYSKTVGGVDALYSIVQMPSGINGAKNAAILAAKMLSISDQTLREKLKEYKESLKESVVAKDEKLTKLGYEEYSKQ